MNKIIGDEGAFGTHGTVAPTAYAQCRYKKFFEFISTQNINSRAFERFPLFSMWVIHTLGTNLICNRKLIPYSEHD